MGKQGGEASTPYLKNAFSDHFRIILGWKLDQDMSGPPQRKPFFRGLQEKLIEIVLHARVKGEPNAGLFKPLLKFGNTANNLVSRHFV